MAGRERPDLDPQNSIDCLYIEKKRVSHLFNNCGLVGNPSGWSVDWDQVWDVSTVMAVPAPGCRAITSCFCSAEIKQLPLATRRQGPGHSSGMSVHITSFSSQSEIN